ncbi:MraY family glycosyltransferase [Proteinivorax hydrogeniformans]|uniref:MraY family glycosyltransferase n=1 Tax=Proteinivorax hydrogeniformans TaxID=1826727 RepID=A0AAU8HWX0_9FIRM
MGNLLYISLGFLLCLIAIPFSMKIGEKFILDKPSKRKIHTIAKPRSGGIAIFAAFIAANLMLDIVPDKALIPITLVFILGIIDDMYTLKAKGKLTSQIVIGLVTYLVGFEFSYISIGEMTLHFSTVPSILLTILWVTAIMNAVNLIDGLDGLSSLLSSISLTTFLIITLFLGSSLQGLILVYLGATLAFFIYNKFPAKIFLGDCGSLQLGYILSLASLDILAQNTNTQVIGIIFLVFVPVFDTTCAIIRRSANKQPIFAPDCKHIHHKLLAHNISPCNSCYILGILSVLAAIAGTAILLMPNIMIIILLSILMSLIAYLAYAPEKCILPIYTKITLKELATTSDKSNSND